MKIDTAHFGPQEINDEDIITFPQGLAGFENNTRFKVFHEAGKPTVHWMQAVDDENLCFSVMDPALLNLGYEFSLSDEQSQLIDLQEQDDLAVLVILSKGVQAQDDFSEDLPSDTSIRANISGPVVINVRSRRAVQVYLRKAERLTIIRSTDTSLDN